MSAAASEALVCFGKLPTQGDFVRSGSHPDLIAQLDRWVSSAMETMSAQAHWKDVYDRCQPWDFAFVGTDGGPAIAGHLRPSHDAAGRRFPLLAAALSSHPAVTLSHSPPLCFTELWPGLQRIAAARTADDAAHALQAGGTDPVALAIARGLARHPPGQFARTCRIAELDRLLAGAGGAPDSRRIVLALGLLLRPASGRTQPPWRRCLALPLPATGEQRDEVAAFWLQLIGGFLRQRRCELQLLFGARQQRPCLLVGFHGASPWPLLHALRPGAAADLIELDDPEWVEPQPELAGEPAIARLSACLSQPALTLDSALDAFRVAFHGA